MKNNTKQSLYAAAVLGTAFICAFIGEYGGRQQGRTEAEQEIKKKVANIGTYFVQASIDMSHQYTKKQKVALNMRARATGNILQVLNEGSGHEYNRRMDVILNETLADTLE
jgi:hypothetical protein